MKDFDKQIQRFTSVACCCSEIEDNFEIIIFANFTDILGMSEERKKTFLNFSLSVNNLHPKIRFDFLKLQTTLISLNYLLLIRLLTVDFKLRKIKWFISLHKISLFLVINIVD